MWSLYIYYYISIYETAKKKARKITKYLKGIQSSLHPRGGGPPCNKSSKIIQCLLGITASGAVTGVHTSATFKVHQVKICHMIKCVIHTGNSYMNGIALASEGGDIRVSQLNWCARLFHSGLE